MLVPIYFFHQLSLKSTTCLVHDRFRGLKWSNSFHIIWSIVPHIAGMWGIFSSPTFYKINFFTAHKCFHDSQYVGARFIQYYTQAVNTNVINAKKKQETRAETPRKKTNKQEGRLNTFAFQPRRIGTKFGQLRVRKGSNCAGIH